MVIVVEGIDRVGKTTLCGKLSQRTGYPIFKKDREEVQEVSDKESAMINYGNATGIIQMVNNGYADNFIMDRFQWTEAVYGYIDRKCKQSYYLMKKAEQQMSDRFLMVYVRPTSLSRSNEEHGSDLTGHLNMFDGLSGETKLRCVTCTYYGLEKAVDRIIQIIKETEGNEK